jgi:hypothetical protein
MISDNQGWFLVGMLAFFLIWSLAFLTKEIILGL